MKTETSAGGVVVQKKKGTWHVLLMSDQKENWTFPKGLVEAGERPEETAVREIREEVGLSRLVLLSSLSPITYFYNRDGIIKKTVMYFLFKSTDQRKPVGQKSEGIGQVAWFTPEKARETIGYRKTNVPLLKEVMKLLE